MAAMEVFSPVFRTPDMASPASRRRRPLTLVSTNTPTSHLAANDDAAEKRQRRLSKVTSVALSSPATPRSSTRLDSESNRGQTASGLTNFQLKDLYSSCIKLSAENKINSKNAFGLDLIDYMQDLIKTVKEGEMTNFQVASCTLDASAKIYAGRVDSIHAQAYKMLGGLGRAENNQADGEAQEGVEDEQSGKKRQKKTNRKQGNTIETNKKNLDVNQFDLEFEVDPLFHKTSASFDEGGTQGLLLNSLSVRDDMCELLLDSSAIVTPLRDMTTEGQSSQDTSMVDLSELRDVYSNVNLDNFQICPHFTEFEFTNWSRDEQNKVNFTTAMAQLGSDEHAFDMDAPATEVDCDYPEAVGGDYSDDDMAGDMEFGGDGCDGDLPGGRTAVTHVLANATLAFADGQEARLITSQDGTRLPPETLGSAATTLGTLCLELSEQPNEYSYFKSNMLATWAGPEHWKMRARLSKLAGLSTDSGQDQQSKKKRAKKEAFKLSFDVELDFKKHFAKSRAATTLAKSTLDKQSATKTTLPEDLHYDADSLFRLFIKPKILVRRQIQAQPEVSDDGSEWYNYNNANDAVNYCPAGVQDDDDYDDDDVAGGGDLGPPDMTTAPDMTYDMTNSSQGLSLSNNESVMDFTMFAGDGLVSQPNKVQKIDIGYAKTAKKMDVKKLKAAMWKLIVHDNKDINKENVPDEVPKETAEVDLNKDAFCDPRSFKDIFSQLPNKISKHMSKNLSVPIAFVCILHLANEKCLKMSPNPEMSDFAVVQEG